MLRRTSRVKYGFISARPGGNTAKHSDAPGLWGPDGGPAQDTLARRFEFGKKVLSFKIGKLTAPFKTQRSLWIFRRVQARLFKLCVMIMFASGMFLLGNVWMLVISHAMVVGSSTSVLERKVREHRVSKQIIGMVRERERELEIERDEQLTAHVLKGRFEQQRSILSS